MGCCGVGCKALVIKDVQYIYTVRKYLLLYAVQTAACGNCLKLYAQLVCKRAALGEQFLTDRSHLDSFQLAIYEYAVHGLSYYMVCGQFLNQSGYLLFIGTIALALLGLEYNVLNLLYLGG